MKKLLIVTLLFILFDVSSAQNLIDVYKTGKITLKADKEFAKNTDWKTVFGDYFDKQYKRPVGKVKDMAISAGGNIFISSRSSYRIHKFDKNGNFVKSFGNKGDNPGEFKNRASLSDIFANRYLLTYEIHGRMKMFDLSGEFYQPVKIDYGVTDCFLLNENTIALLGYVGYGNSRARRLVALKNIQNGDENYICSFMEDMSKDAFYLKAKDREPRIQFSKPFSRGSLLIAKTPEGNIVTGSTIKPELTVFSQQGDELKRISLKINRKKITQKIKDEYINSFMELQDKRKEYYKNYYTGKELDEVVNIFKSPEFFPEYLPYYYEFIADSDGNILVFIYSDEKGSPRFQVYSPDGDYVCETVFDPGEYELGISSRNRNIAFYNGDLYCLVPLRETEGIPLRLIKVNLTE